MAMNLWDQRIREHRVWAEMKSLGPAIDNALKVGEIAPESFAGLERLRAILGYCGKRIAAADPLITTPGPLDEIANSLTVTRNELDAFISNQNSDHVVTANVAADKALSFVSQVPGEFSPEELGVLVSIAADYRSTVDEALTSAKDKLDVFSTSSDKSFQELSTKSENGLDGFRVSSEELQAKLGELATNIQAEQQKLTKIVTDQQGQFSTAQETRSKEFTDTLRLAQQDFTKLVTDYQGQFSTGQDIRSKEFALAQATQQNSYNAAIHEYAKKLSDQDSEFTKQRMEFARVSTEGLTTLTNQYEQQAKEILENVQKRQEHVEKLVGVIGNLGVTSGYLRAANQAKYGMWFWQSLTVVAMMTLSGLAYTTLGLLEDDKGHFNWGGFAGRVLLLTSLGIIAAYAGSQADKLFVDEKRNRKLALELEAIGPYLAPLPIEEQNKFRLQIGERSFGREHELDAGTHHKSPATLLHLLLESKQSKDLVQLLINLAKLGKTPE